MAQMKLTVHQAAAMAGISTSAVYKAIRLKKLPATRRYGRIVIERHDMDGYSLRCRSQKSFAGPDTALLVNYRLKPVQKPE